MPDISLSRLLAKTLPVYGEAPQPVILKGQPVAKPVKGTQRSRSLLDLAHEAPCCLQLGVKGCGANPSVPCHSDMLAHGRGAGMKSHDCLAIPGCPACHEAFTRKRLGKDGYLVAWANGMARFLVWAWKNGKLRLA